MKPLVFALFVSSLFGQAPLPGPIQSAGGAGSGTVTTLTWPTIPSWLTVSIATQTTTPAISVTPTAAQTSHQVIGTCGSATTMAPCTLAVADIPTPLNQNTTGTASNLSGTPALPNGTTASTQASADNTTNLATTAFVTTAVANAVTAAAGRDLVTAATAAVLPNTPSFTHVDSGIGSFFTSSTNSVLVVDGYTPFLADRILVKNESTAANNGIYKVTQLGVASVTPWILTRALDYDQPSDMNNTIVPVANNGTSNPKTSWIMTAVVAVVDTDALNFAAFTPAGANIVTASAPGVGVAHFAGSTQAVTSSTIVAADIAANTITSGQVDGSIATVGLTTKTTTYNIAATDNVVLCNSTTAFTVSLPTAAVTTGKVFRVKNINTGICTVNVTGGVAIDGGTTYLLSSQYQAANFAYDGAQYWIF